MNFRFYWDKLNNSKEFKKFKSENPEAYFCSGFFTIDVSDGKDNQRHVDFYSPGENRIFSFKLEGDNVEILPMDTTSGKNPEELDSGIDFSFEEIERLISEEILKQKLKNKLQKIMISLQKAEGKIVLICTVFVSMMGILKIHIDIDENKCRITLFEKKSFFDIIRKD